jgi:hypothetical protein
MTIFKVKIEDTKHSNMRTPAWGNINYVSTFKNNELYNMDDTFLNVDYCHTHYV